MKVLPESLTGLILQFKAPNLSKPISKSTLSEDVTMNESSSSETVTSSSLEVTPEDLPPKSTPENQSSSVLSEIVSNSLPTSVQDHRTPPPTPNKAFFGDEDNNNFSFAKLRSDEMSSFPSGLKRSLSSPNIAQLKDDEEINQKVIPLIDRNSKPSARLSFADSYSPKSHGNVQRGLTGLKNLGNLCYMNSIMQCVSNTEELKRELMSLHSPHKNRNSKTKGLVFDAVKQLIRLLHQGAYRWVSCQELKAVAGQFCNTFAGYEQQDSHEFLTELMDWLHEDLNYPSPNISLDGASEETGEKAWGEFKKNNESIVLNLFYGQLRSTITCSDCNKKSIKFDPFSNLSLPLPMEKDKINLSDCLRLYLRGETISGWICPRCKVPRQAVKKFDITRLPPVLVIHLKRFMTEFVGVGWTRKKGNMVEFPLDDLDMRQYVVNNEQRFHTYNLYAVSNHYGTMDSGHYTAYCKNYALKKWFKFDDQEVAEISSSGVRTSAAYILFYSAIGKS
uniref:Ubiquitin carboxyl-terminal hydrolase n=1 Tax=Clastoptera arizonana TaxID=38151 RepID=A0A1B6E877_9HEMI